MPRSIIGERGSSSGTVRQVVLPRRLAVSAVAAFRNNTSCSGPGAISSAAVRASSANLRRRSSKEDAGRVRFRRVDMAAAPPSACPVEQFTLLPKVPEKMIEGLCSPWQNRAQLAVFERQIMPLLPDLRGGPCLKASGIQLAGDPSQTASPTKLIILHASMMSRESKRES